MRLKLTLYLSCLTTVFVFTVVHPTNRLLTSAFNSHSPLHRRHCNVIPSRSTSAPSTTSTISGTCNHQYLFVPRTAKHSIPSSSPSSSSLSSSSTSSSFASDNNDDITFRSMPDDHQTSTTNNNNNNNNLLQRFTLLTPLWTVLAACFGWNYSNVIGPTLGSVTVVSRSLFILMFGMALSTTTEEFWQAVKKSPQILFLNAVGCFGLMPILAVLVTKFLQCNPSQTIGTILLGCVCGGQASNLFALLAGGNVSLSVVCTLSTTILGVLITPLLIKSILAGYVISSASSSSLSSINTIVDGMAVLRSVVSLVLGPLSLGLGIGHFVFSKNKTKVRQIIQVVLCPIVGITATLLLVAGGAANAAAAGATTIGSEKTMLGIKSILASIALPVAGCVSSLWLVNIVNNSSSNNNNKIMDEPSKRTLVVEILSKSPTLAYVLARKHFDVEAAGVPAAAMVTLAVVGALVASIWSLFPVSSSSPSHSPVTKHSND